MKTLLKTEESENGALRFSVDGQHFKTELFEKDDVTIIRRFVFLKHKHKMAAEMPC